MCLNMVNLRLAVTTPIRYTSQIVKMSESGVLRAYLIGDFKFEKDEYHYFLFLYQFSVPLLHNPQDVVFFNQCSIYNTSYIFNIAINKKMVSLKIIIFETSTHVIFPS